MSDYSVQRLPMAGRLKMTACALAAVFSLSLGAGSAAIAQDANPAATPAPTCNAPALPPGSPSATDASPSADAPATAMPAMATPAAATPEAAAPAGTPAAGAAAADIIAAAQAIADCANAGDYKGLVALMTPHMLQSTFQITNPYDAVNALTGQTFGNFSATNAKTYADGSVSVDASYTQSQYQHVTEQWTLVKDGDYSKIDSFSPLTPTTGLDTSVLGIALAGAKDAKTGKMVYSITPATFDTATGVSHVTEAPALSLHVTNIVDGAEDHELVLLKLPAGMDQKAILDPKTDQSKIEGIGQITVPAGKQQDMLLIGLPAGTYTMVCFFTGPDGVSHAMEGMIGTLIVDPKP